MTFLLSPIIYFTFLFSSPFSLFPHSVYAQTTQPSPASSSPAKPQFDDYAYFKKYGRSGKAWNDFVRDGFDAYDKQDCDKTISFLKEAIGAGCTDPLVYFKLAACSEFTGSYYSACQYYKQSEDGLKTLSAPHRYSKDFYEAYGRCLYLNKKTDEAFTYLTKAADLGTPTYSLFYLLGELNMAKGQSQAAIQYFNRAISLPMEGATAPQLARIYGSLGKAFLDTKDIEKAIQYLDQALKYSPSDADLQAARYKAGEVKRQEEIFKMMQGISNPTLPPMKPVMPK
jgi:tetratricopeptide (TPR) repeat protein